MPNTFKTAPNQRSKSKIAIAIVLALAVAIGAAFAFLTAKDEKINTFTYGKVDIEVIEPKWDAANPDGIIEKVVPTKSYDKDPQITNTGDNDAYVYMRVWMPKVDEVSVFTDTMQPNGTYTISNQYDVPLFTTEKEENNTDKGTWSLITEYQKEESVQAYNYYVYAYSVPLAPGETSATLFDRIITTNIAKGTENILSEYQNVIIEGFAIQADTGDTTFATAKDAWTMYVKQEGYQWPDNPVANYYSFVSYDLNYIQKVEYETSDEIIQLPDSISPLNEMAFEGWIDEKGIMHTTGDEITVEELYISHPQNDNQILNENPKLTEVVTYSEKPNNSNSSLPVKLVPINNQSTAMIERGWTYKKGYYSQSGPIESYNEGYSVITNEYGYEQTDDYNGWVVYGLKENLTAKSLFSDFVTVQGDGYAVVTPSSGNIAGTGSVIKVYDRNGTETTDDDTFVEQFYVIIYGDNNGDGFITREDAKITYDEAVGLTHWSNIGFNGGIDYSAPKTRASSLAHLGAADAISASIMEDYYYQLLKIDQVTGRCSYLEHSQIEITFYRNSNGREIDYYDVSVPCGITVTENYIYEIAQRYGYFDIVRYETNCLNKTTDKNSQEAYTINYYI